jgi:hypothetical protein
MAQQASQFLKKILYCKQVPGTAPVVGVSVEIFYRGACELTIFQVKPICCPAVNPVFGNNNIISIITKTYNEYL